MMIEKRQEKLKKIVSSMREAQKIATELGFNNLLQPGLVKEIIAASILDHEVHKTKHDADAWDPHNPNLKYEYLTCLEGGTFQLDRMFKFPEDKKQKSLLRITRNDCFYCIVFYRKSPLEIKIIFEIKTEDILTEALRQLEASSNNISHIGFTIPWAREIGRIVYSNDN